VILCDNKRKIFRYNLHKLIDQQSKVPAEIARDLGLSRNTFYDWMKGNTYPRPERIEMLEKYFGVSTGYFEKSNLETDKAFMHDYVQFFRNSTELDRRMLAHYLELGDENKYLVQRLVESLYKNREQD
jgi:transcriptional regulator with XRE-family HTH domain